MRRRALADFRLDGGFVDGEHLASFGDNTPRHHRHRHGAAVGAIDKLAADVVQRRERQMIEIDQDQVGLLAGLKRADLRAGACRARRRA